MVDIEQMKKIVPIITCEISFGQNVCEFMSGINVSNQNFGIKINLERVIRVIASRQQDSSVDRIQADG